jgi:hypothetical protein
MPGNYNGFNKDAMTTQILECKPWMREEYTYALVLIVHSVRGCGEEAPTGRGYEEEMQVRRAWRLWAVGRWVMGSVQATMSGS